MKDRLRVIPVHEVCRALGQRICEALPAFHALTGCDTNSSLAGIEKKKAWDALKRSNVHQDSLSLLGQAQDLDETTATKCEAFICDLYVSSKRTPKTIDELRYFMFCQKKTKNENYTTTPQQIHWLQQFQWHNLRMSHGPELLARMDEQGLYVFPTHRLEWQRNKTKLLECNRQPNHPVAKIKAVHNG